MGRPKGNRKGRSASGRKRDRTVQRVEPCDGYLRRQKAYSGITPANDEGHPIVERKYTDTCDAIGRAYAAGLLGSGDEAKRRLDAGRLLAWRYWRITAPQFATPDSLARFQPQTPGRPSNPEREKDHETKLHEALTRVSRLGREHRRAFDQLVIDMHPDSGPDWLDRMLWAIKRGQGVEAADLRRSRLAADALEQC